MLHLWIYVTLRNEKVFMWKTLIFRFSMPCCNICLSCVRAFSRGPYLPPSSSPNQTSKSGTSSVNRSYSEQHTFLCFFFVFSKCTNKDNKFDLYIKILLRVAICWQFSHSPFASSISGLSRPRREGWLFSLPILRIWLKVMLEFDRRLPCDPTSWIGMETDVPLFITYSSPSHYHTEISGIFRRFS